MKNVKKVNKLILALLVLISVLHLNEIRGHAERPIIDFVAGAISFTTKDTKATTDITWGTVGFTITRKPCLPNGDPTKYPHATLWMTPDMKDDTNDSGSHTYVKFTIPVEDVNKALNAAGFEEIQENDLIYVHTIFQVYHDGKPHGKRIYTLNDIKGAESWNNTSDFDDHFDVPTLYHGGKSPVTTLYLDASGKVIKKVEMEPVEPGKKTTLTFDKTMTYGGKKLYICKSYILKQSTGKRINDSTHWVTSVTSKTYEEQLIDKEILSRSQKQIVGGIVYVARMVEKRQADNKSVEILPPYATGIIAADDRDNEQFDVTDGIPTTENLYTNVFSSKYLLGYVFLQKIGKKSYTVTATKTYNLSWEELDPKTMKKVTKTATKSVTQSVNIYRYYSYWYINNMEYYRISNAAVNNYSLTNGKTVMEPKNYSVPDLDYEHTLDEDKHIIEPIDPSRPYSVDLGSESCSGQSPPAADFTGEVDGMIGQIQVRNDRLKFDGNVIMNNNYVSKDGKEPEDIEIDGEDIDEDVLYESAQTIERNKSNGRFGSTGSITYEALKTINPRVTGSLTYPVNELSDVVIHTPTVCDAFVSDMKVYNQMLNPDTTKAPLVLDTTFTIMLPTTGSHRYINGYGYNDYAKYIDRRQVKFPFDVYQGTTYIPTGSWTTLSSETTQFYLPIWVNEGNYTIDFRSISINADANQALNQTETLANLSLQNYVATDTINVQVSGRIYNLKLYDISDYPIWQDVFRKPNSLKLTGFQYTVGTKNQNGTDTGQNAKYTIPLVNGSHPTRSGIGAIKSGYVTRFHLVTIGNMFSDKDYIKIRPRFYYVDAKGNNKQEVDIYYTETFLGKKQVLIKAGSLLDSLNVKAFHLGDTYLSVPEAEITTKSYITGKSVNEIKDKKANLFTFTNIMIPEALRTYIGSNYTPTGSVPNGVDERKVTTSMQKWYAEYYLPSDIHVVPKGYDVQGYSKNNGGLDYQETFWLNDGYVIVNFDIETIQNGVRHLSYLNLENAAKGFCNMWNKEGFIYGKVDEKGNRFQFVDGDTFLYFTDKSAARDYRAGGTH